MKLLIDADYIVYKSCAGAETEIDFGEDLIMVTSLFSDAMRSVKNELNKIKKEFFDPELILFFRSTLQSTRPIAGASDKGSIGNDRLKKLIQLQIEKQAAQACFL